MNGIYKLYDPMIFWEESMAKHVTIPFTDIQFSFPFQKVFKYD